jgi:hypothetical protein
VTSAMRQRVVVAGAIAILVAAIVTGQIATDARTPAGLVTGTGATVGRAAFSYLAGLRAFAAYELWNRLEPQLHEYYGSQALKDQTFSVPTMSVVMMLKPDFAAPFYILPWILIENGKKAEGMRIAALGVENNPRSGLLLMSYAQLLALKQGDWDAAAVQSDVATRADTFWADPVEEWQSLRIAESIYEHVGQSAKVSAVAARLDALDTQIGQTPSADGLGENHDHNGDGLPDH